jgi:hypothetical protein
MTLAPAGLTFHPPLAASYWSTGLTRSRRLVV